MVLSTFARQDIDKYMLTKTCVYRRRAESKSDLSLDEFSVSYSEVTVRFQATIQKMDSKFVKEGILAEGDAVALFRYQYETDASGSVISPPLVPEKGDEFIFLGRKFIIKQCTPATSEDDGIIAWDVQASQISTDSNYG